MAKIEFWLNFSVQRLGNAEIVIFINSQCKTLKKNSLSNGLFVSHFSPKATGQKACNDDEKQGRTFRWRLLIFLFSSGVLNGVDRCKKRFLG